MTAAIYVGIDDTDNVDGGGTGRVARALAAELEGVAQVRGVSRHQLLVDDRIPYTRNNSCNVIHVASAAGSLERLADHLASRLSARALPGSDPGLCVAAAEQLTDGAFGARAQAEVLTQAAALAFARAQGLILRPLGGTGDGIIGALAGALLAATGNDGRFVDLGGIRALEGRVSVERLLAAGIAEIRDAEGTRVSQGWVEEAGEARPDLRGGRAVLTVEPAGRDVWRVPLRRPGQRGNHR